MGAVTFLEKPCRDQELWLGIQQALDVDRQRQIERGQQAEVAARIASLTPEEVAILHMMLAGRVNKRMAIDLGIGLRTVELRRSIVMKKMQATSLPDLVRLAILGGFLQPELPA
jgi:FixJ family two-component response regulator